MTRHAVFLVVCGVVLLAPVVLAVPAAAAVAPVHLQGSESLEATAQVIDAFAAGVTARDYRLVRPLYSKDVVYDDFAFNIHEGFGPYVMWKLRRDLRSVDGIRVLATHADRGWSVMEHRWDFEGGAIWVQAITLLEVGGGDITYEAWYYQDPLALAVGGPPAPTPLDSAPAPSDTPAVAEAVAVKYADALQARDAAVIAALSAPKIAFLDTAAGVFATRPGQVRLEYARIFARPADLAFADLRYVCGAGWAAVFWTAWAQSLDPSVGGATMLEIRGGKIARETLYYTVREGLFGP